MDGLPHRHDVPHRWTSRAGGSTGLFAAILGTGFLLLLALNSVSPGVDSSESWLAAAVIAIVFPAVGALIVAHHPAHGLGWLMLGIGLLTAAEVFTDEYATYALLTNPGLLPGGELAAWIGSFSGQGAFFALPLVLLLFPDGRLPSRRWRPVAWVTAFTAAAVTVAILLMPGPLADHQSVTNPTGIDAAGPLLGRLTELPAVAVPFAGCLLAGVAALVLRFRRARGVERQQLKWFTYAAILLPVSLAGQTVFPGWAWLIGGFAAACLPVAIGIAVLRYHLYDIDLLINRTLVYGALTVAVVVVYVGVISSLGALLSKGGNLVVSLVGTAVVAVLFAPVRDRLQRAVNRLMYGERDDPYAAVSRLGQRLESAMAPEDVLPAVLGTIREALKLPYAAIAFPQDGTMAVAASSGEYRPGSADRPLALPLSHSGETVGELVVAPRAPGEGFSPADRRLLDGLAGHAGVAVYGVRAMADLRRSRERLVLAREEERRRLGRDLHDELAPTLAALGLTAATVGELISTDPAQAARVNHKLVVAVRATVGDVRRLVYDLRPPVLDQLGLVEAIKDRAARNSSGDGSLRVTVQAPDDLPALPAAVEVAAYRIVQEALTNVSRHARARECRVRLGCEDGRALGVEVVDDGVGLSAPAGVGLASMRERAAELGGVCEIGGLPPPATGTRVFAHLPLAMPVPGARTSPDAGAPMPAAIPAAVPVVTTAFTPDLRTG